LYKEIKIDESPTRALRKDRVEASRYGAAARYGDGAA